MQELILSRSCEIFRVLIQEHRAMHREYIYARRPDPLVYQTGDLVFARQTVQSNRQKGRVGKVTIKHTGPWKITESLPGGSYRLQHLKSGHNDKKNTSQLSPCPEQLIPYPPPCQGKTKATARSTAKSKSTPTSRPASTPTSRPLLGKPRNNQPLLQLHKLYPMTLPQLLPN
jgi:hypothetical protein